MDCVSRFSGYGQTFKASQIGKEFGYRTLLNTFSVNKQAAGQDMQVKDQKQSQGISVGGSLLAGLGAVINTGGSMRGSEAQDREEERRRRQKKKGRKNGRKI